VSQIRLVLDKPDYHVPQPYRDSNAGKPTPTTTRNRFEGNGALEENNNESHPLSQNNFIREEEDEDDSKE